jgi:hypothetical protein
MIITITDISPSIQELTPSLHVHLGIEAMLSPDGQWVHIDSTLDYPISLNHPYYYEENWGKEYEYE